MSFTSGTATDQNDLLGKLKTWLTGLSSAWTADSYSAGATVADPSTLYIHGPGAGGGRLSWLGFQTWNSPGLPAAGLEAKCNTGYSSSVGFSAQPNASPSAWLSLQAESTPYWFYANDRRVIIVAQVGLVFVSLYAGMFLPNALPAEYPQPLFICGNWSTKQVAGYNDSGNRFFIDPATGNGNILPRSSLTWVNAKNNTAGQGYEFYNHDVTGVMVWPHRGPPAFQSAPGSTLNTDGANIFNNLRPNASGERTLWPASLFSEDAQELLGTVDGAYAVPGFNLTATQAITIGGRTFRCFPNVFRSAGRDWMAIEEA